jgi:hypothetical protein
LLSPFQVCPTRNNEACSKVEPSQLRSRVVVPAVFRLHECVPLPEARLVSTLSRVKALSALFSFLLRNPNWLANLHMAGDIAWLKEPYATLGLLFI